MTWTMTTLKIVLKMKELKMVPMVVLIKEETLVSLMMVVKVDKTMAMKMGSMVILTTVMMVNQMMGTMKANAKEKKLLALHIDTTILTALLSHL